MIDHMGSYLAQRRALGFKLTTAESRLRDFCRWLDQRGGDGFTAAEAIEWAKAADVGASSHAARLSCVRPFAVYLAGLGLPVEVPDHKAFPAGITRATPFLYSQQDFDALMASCPALFGRYPLTGATMPVFVGLLAVTGIRTGEALCLDEADIDPAELTLTIRGGKFGKDRIVPVHQSTSNALAAYLNSPVRRRYARPGPGALFITMRGTRARPAGIQARFRLMVEHAGIRRAESGARPRLHDFRHSLAVHTMIDAYRRGGDPARTLTVLSTWLGHTEPANTYWYLEGAPELLALSAERLEQHTPRPAGGAS
ncbi:MAG: tyrosine-type recombinase/integrase [Bifidobacteriaceae bacterium]|jgi:integrase|nr:tyrosine-type recombinase/integrase [Bifidobacteriaceae bacterium]